MKLYKNVLPEKSFSVLLDIMNNPRFDNLYLAGGTALSLQLGHRESIDLDLFSSKEFKTNLITGLKDYQVIILNDNSIEITLNETKILFFYFSFPLYKDILIKDNIRLADPIDIGLMKLLALQGRSTKKDIVDLYLIHKEVIPLDKLLDIFETHFPKESFNSYSSLKGLIDDNLFKSEPMPKMLKEINWNEALNTVKVQLMEHLIKVTKNK